MAKKAKKNEPYVKFEIDTKTLAVLLSRAGLGIKACRLQFPIPGRPTLARVLYEGEDANDEDAGWHIDHSDVQWLSQALPELLSEMERRGIDE